MRIMTKNKKHDRVVFYWLNIDHFLGLNEVGINLFYFKALLFENWCLSTRLICFGDRFVVFDRCQLL